MKFSAIAFFALLSLAGLASAKPTYVTGDFKNIDHEKLEIAIVADTGDVKAYKIEPAALKKMKSYKVGDSVTLKLEPAKSKI